MRFLFFVAILFKWSDNSLLLPSDYQNWFHPAQALIISLKCVAEVKTSNKGYNWRAMTCKANFPFVCERDPFAPTEPLTCGNGYEMVNGKCEGLLL